MNKFLLALSNHPSRPRHMPEDLNCGLARKQPTGKNARQAFALFVQVATQVATQVVHVQMVREGGLAKIMQCSYEETLPRYSSRW